MNLFRNLFKRKKKEILLEGQYKIVEAFDFKGKKYYMFEDIFKISSGRGLTALSVYEEFRMRCTLEYLQKHVEAYEHIFSDPKKININLLVMLNQNLKERINLALPSPGMMFKMASIMFFEDKENPFIYDYEFNKKKIAGWEADPEALSFFASRPLTDLIPSLMLPEENAETYFRMSDMVDKHHQQKIQETLSREK